MSFSCRFLVGLKMFSKLASMWAGVLLSKRFNTVVPCAQDLLFSSFCSLINILFVVGDPLQALLRHNCGTLNMALITAIFKEPSDLHSFGDYWLTQASRKSKANLAQCEFLHRIFVYLHLLLGQFLSVVRVWKWSVHKFFSIGRGWNSPFPLRRLSLVQQIVLWYKAILYTVAAV